MCGIVGYIGHRSANEVLISGLRKLEYRGYDSAGVATIPLGDRSLHRVRAKGKLIQLEEKLNTDTAPSAPIGIGHTRWATHGKPEEHNAHPHTNNLGNLAVVQNGIVENYHLLRTELKELGHIFVSETDTEVIPHMIAEFLLQLEKQDNIIPDNSPSVLFEAVRLTVAKLQGAYAIAVIHADYPDELVVVRQQAPLVIGIGKEENFCASDTPALVAYTRTVIPLENGEIARLTRESVQVYNAKGDRLRRTPQTLNWNPTMVEKQGFKHYMLKEIYEQPGVFRAGLASYISENDHLKLGLPKGFVERIERVEIIACGTSWHASLVGKYLLEQIAGVPTSVQYASEYRYSPPPSLSNTLVIGVTQSGETADTLAALELAKLRGDRCLGITNRVESSIGRIADAVIDTQAGIEIGVAATKTFIAQLLMFYILALEFGITKGSLSSERSQELIDGLRQLPAYMERILESQERYIEELSRQFTHTKDFIFLGRGINFPIALEGALKLKEISYIHAEGYPAGEMKHGPIALLDEDVPVVAIATPGSVYEKVLSNSQEAKARDAKLIGVAPLDDPAAHEVFDYILPIPVVDEIFSPILTVIPLQLLAYHVAAHRGLDVDQPRNLAKSVTVE
ncbi:MULTISPECIES: glutamine--fructose-6-phosphate transaminase (isomerizing) [Pseudanabaena]|uniref:Glutamine--fructose-6-phosphate aminotransferase [isomerizing] n=2 Tax=Pseudanabaena TaxID=1152 RepID=L8N350_9CYAN|nr:MULTISPECIES: glutamine--fructose-6-phosphate transaminase (isomerizing) [Pseudanabaena]ELS33145.1 glutamine--fructose-6-phosphate transaminase [Pseudanabaena biceps PCC 7429]MDG3494622.1 glutamine--fructose-6-phosphate transaminase (isomerizing) [Pseudanabaena catenata USMAC16]